MKSCLICGSADCEVVLDLGSQPVSSHFMKSPNATAIAHELALALCHSCGMVQLERPFPSKDLVPPYDWIAYREPEAHLDAVTETILELPGIGQSSVAASLSFKDTTILDRLRARNFSRVWSIDPRGDLGARDPNANIESVQSLLTPEKAAEIVSRRGTADLLIARHILEHAEDPRRFLAALGALLSPGGYLVIEVPDCRANLERQDYAMIWEEHTLYFTERTVSPILSAAGCVAVGQAVFRYPFEDVIVIYGRKTPSGEPRQVKVEPAMFADTVPIVRAFGGAFDTWTDRYRRLFDDWAKGGRRLGAYGAGHLTCAFVNFHRLHDYFAFVVDDTPQKQSLYLPGCGLPIVPRSRLTAAEASACLFGLGPQAEDKIIAVNASYLEAGGRFHSMLVDSQRSIRKALPES